MSNTGFLQNNTLTSVTEDNGLPARTGYRGKTPLVATIAANGTLSTAITIPSGYRIDAIVIPATWVSANITVQVSNDNSNYYDLYTYGNEFYITPVAGKATCLSPENSLLVSKLYVKFRSGFAASTVTQTSETALTCWLVSM